MINKILDRLQNVRQNGGERWMACCPAHKDGSPSLSVRISESGNVLVYCFGGCSTLDVLAAIGLEFKDLQGAHSTIRAPRKNYAQESENRACVESAAKKHSEKMAEFIRENS